MYAHCSASGFKLLDAPSPSYAFREFLKRSRDKHQLFSQPAAHHPPPPLTHTRRTPVPYIPRRPPKTRLGPADSVKWANSSRAHPIWKSVSPLHTRKQLRFVECPGRQVGGLSPEHTYVCGSAARCCRACASLKVAFLFIFYFSLHFNNRKLLFLLLLLVFFLFLYFYTKYDVYRDRGMYVYTS